MFPIVHGLCPSHRPVRVRHPPTPPFLASHPIVQPHTVSSAPRGSEQGSCWFHEGEPAFQDIMKGWTCCSKRVMDFNDFLEIRGCCNGRHAAVQPKAQSGATGAAGATATATATATVTPTAAEASAARAAYGTMRV